LMHTAVMYYYFSPSSFTVAASPEVISHVASYSNIRELIKF